MADASRFPHLAFPFAIAGAAAGWLSSGLVQHPLIYTLDGHFRIVSASVAMGFGAVVGLLLRRWCIGERYDWEFDAPDPEARPTSDSWPRHVSVILFAGAAAGILVMSIRDRMGDAHVGLLAGLLCAIPFLPVCAAVLNAARSAQRARLGSLVASADRRAVWSILSVTLLVATLEALPDWVAPHTGVSGPAPTGVILLVATACITIVLIADFWAYRKAKRATSPTLGLILHEDDERAADMVGASKLDLGIGSEVHAHVKRGVAAYRGRNEVLALVQGDPDEAVRSLRRALHRGILSLGVASALFIAHFGANSQQALAYYQGLRCKIGIEQSCGDAVAGGLSVGELGLSNAIALFGRSCDRGDARSCMSIADLYRGEEGPSRDVAVVAFFEYRAAQRGLCPEGQRLVRSRENICVHVEEPRR